MAHLTNRILNSANTNICVCIHTSWTLSTTWMQTNPSDFTTVINLWNEKTTKKKTNNKEKQFPVQEKHHRSRKTNCKHFVQHLLVFRHKHQLVFKWSFFIRSIRDIFVNSINEWQFIQRCHFLLLYDNRISMLRSIHFIYHFVNFSNWVLYISWSILLAFCVAISIDYEKSRYRRTNNIIYL